ncbi:MAG: DUF2442 domain-containing protein [Anaerolineae bacterium]|nr:DUF2442 domain-containing protein [Anaerolineae bacterium]
MLIDIVRVTPLANYELQLLFEDGTNGIVNVAEIVEFTGVFAPLKDKTYFDQVQVNPDIGTICWPNEADIDPDVLYSLITGEPLPDFSPVVASAS